MAEIMVVGMLETIDDLVADITSSKDIPYPINSLVYREVETQVEFAIGSPDIEEIGSLILGGIF